MKRMLFVIGALALVLPACRQATPGAIGPSPASPRATASPSTTPTSQPSIPATLGSWRLLPKAPIAAPYARAGVWDGTELLVAGRVSVPQGGSYDVAAAYNPTTGTWRKLPPAPGPEGSYEGGDRAVWTGTEMLLWGVTNTAYKSATNTWRKLPQPPAGAGGPSVAVWTGKQMIGWGGGCCGDVYSDGAAYTPATNSWTMLPASPLSGRHTTGAWTGKEMILIGGSDDEGGHLFADAAAYNPAAHTWRTLRSMPAPRSNATAVWDGTEILVVGGRGANGLYARGVAFNPSTNRWRWLPAMEFPREGHVAVWTGKQLLVWGGTTGPEGSMTTPGHGEAYHPLTNRWSALPKAPIRGRAGAIGVWARNQMIVWGGFPVADGDHGQLVDGAAYRPGNP